MKQKTDYAISHNSCFMFHDSCLMKKGYTLIEILVAISIFLIVIAAPTGFFVTSIKGQKKALASQELLDNVSFTLEYMSRAIRMAKKDKGGDCIDKKLNYQETYFGQGIKFLNYQNECQEIFLDGDGRLKESINGSAPVPLTSDDLYITYFKIASDESWGQLDNLQPRITLSFEIKRKNPRPEMEPKIKIQTTISQRNLDFVY